MVDILDHSNPLLLRIINQRDSLKSLKLTTEMVSLDEEEKQMLLSKKIDYIITQVQESKRNTDSGTFWYLNINLNSKTP